MSIEDRARGWDEDRANRAAGASVGPWSAALGTEALVAALVLGGCGQPPFPGTPADGTEGSSDTGVASSSGEPPADGSSSGQPPEVEVTWHGDVRAVIEQHCMSCHQPGNIGPFPMTSYEEAHALREAIAYVMEDGSMPPWMPADGCQDYQGQPSIADDEVTLVRAWVDGGGPEGDPDDYQAPPPPEPTGLSRVDLELALPEPYLPTAQPDDYRCFLLDWPETTTTYVTGFNAKPDDLRTVHHMIAYAIAPAQVEEYEGLEAADPALGYTCFGGPGGAITGPESAGTWLGAWAPGGTSGDYPEGTGIEMAPGSKVVLQIHYNTLVDDVRPDASAMELKIDGEVERVAFTLPWADPEWLFGNMPIPAGQAGVVHTWDLDPTFVMSYFTDAIPPAAPIEIHSAVHHMHKLGTRGEQRIDRADGSQTCLLQLPRWDFDWQQAYSFAEPVRLEPGDSLHLGCEWDNSAGESNVNWGEGTGDEMCLGVYYITAAQ
jgi:mono/diheme cytochrome c family protein